MQFQLPSNLQTELLAYDPKLKALVAEQTRLNKKPGAKPKYPLGNINDLIPADVVAPSLQQQAIDHINSQLAPERHQIFTRIKGQDIKVSAIIYHFEQCWVAAWLPPKGKESEYVYGYTVAYKNTTSALKVVTHKIARQREQYQLKNYGRSEVYYYQKFVTIKDIQDGLDTSEWRLPGITSYGAKPRFIDRTIKRFEEGLRTTLPTWEDSRTSLFERIKCKCIGEVVLENQQVYKRHLEITNKLQTWQPSAATYLEMTEHYSSQDTRSYSSQYKYSNRIKHIIDTPYFRKWIQEQCDLSSAAYHSADNQQRGAIAQPWRRINLLFNAINSIHYIWPDTPVDYFQNNIDTMLTMEMDRAGMHISVVYWLRQHMPVASYFAIARKAMEEKLQNDASRYMNTEYGIKRYSCYEWNDTISMLSRIAAASENETLTLAPPRRWRITEFHDYVQAEAWKIRNKNESLPQDLFPEPIKVQYNDKAWSLFQPLDTHQLAAWGQAVRNCVGSANSYAEGVRKKQHFIVLCLLDGKPHFTIQLRVEHGVMSVDQIKGYANSSLNDRDREEYTAVFKEALRIRDEQLSSKS
jgi:hypothetical protein